MARILGSLSWHWTFCTRIVPSLHFSETRLHNSVCDSFPTERWIALLKQLPDHTTLVSPGLPSILGLISQTTDRAVLMAALKLLQTLLSDINIQKELLSNEVSKMSIIKATNQPINRICTRKELWPKVERFDTSACCGLELGVARVGDHVCGLPLQAISKISGAFNFFH